MEPAPPPDASNELKLLYRRAQDNEGIAQRVERQARQVRKLAQNSWEDYHHALQAHRGQLSVYDYLDGPVCQRCGEPIPEAENAREEAGFDIHISCL